MPELKRVGQNDIEVYGFIDGQFLNRQLYEAQPRPFGVEIFKHNAFKDPNGGYFAEVVRYDELGRIKALADRGINTNFQTGQISFSRIMPGTERFGHVHPDQDEYWYIATGVLSLGLYDLRKDSPTSGEKFKVVIAEHTGIYLPHGVVHGFGNYGVEPVNLIYNPSHQFSPNEDTQELRFVPDDPEFWSFTQPEKF